MQHKPLQTYVQRTISAYNLAYKVHYSKHRHKKSAGAGEPCTVFIYLFTFFFYQKNVTVVFYNELQACLLYKSTMSVIMLNDVSVQEYCKACIH